MSRSAVQVEPIGKGNLEDVVCLLAERNKTRPEYTRWKYSQGEGRFCGVVGRVDGKPVGCFGTIQRSLELPGGERISCGWFADWYVTPGARGGGIGIQLLLAISEALRPMFGHPRPPAARAICLANGYQALGFQSTRRLVLRPLAYQRRRTRFLPVAPLRAAAGWCRSAREKWRASVGSGPTESAAPTGERPRLADPEAYGDWISAQPTALGRVDRRVGRWRREGLEVRYVDDSFDRECRRRILFTGGEGRLRPTSWRPFIESARDDGCTYAELFTTEPDLDRVWMILGAWQVGEAPILAAGLPTGTAVALHGWDREGWTYV